MHGEQKTLCFHRPAGGGISRMAVGRFKKTMIFKRANHKNKFLRPTLGAQRDTMPHTHTRTHTHTRWERVLGVSGGMGDPTTRIAQLAWAEPAGGKLSAS